MLTMDFVTGAKAERDALALTYAAADASSTVGALLAEADLSEIQREKVVSALDQALTDAFYKMLLALDGLPASARGSRATG